ncbi:hypothetical protein [Brasilonema bromeliae]|uniref:hypothetical protein n=1 Tax=Brasilonema bromeliae TaxID=383615 RepID=UPI00145C6136|nr:hypothetical protein [Brasilonema bromeliae]
MRGFPPLWRLAVGFLLWVPPGVKPQDRTGSSVGVWRLSVAQPNTYQLGEA